jgi:Concanavalin A-like lectin/glucanases superfamily
MALDKTTGTSTESFQHAAFNGTAWQKVARNETGSSHDWLDLTITEVTNNSARIGRVKFTSTNRNGGASTSQLTLRQAMPFANLSILAAASPSMDRTFLLSPSATSNVKTFYMDVPAGTSIGGDRFGAVGAVLATSSQYVCFPIPALGLDFITSRATDTLEEAFTTASSGIVCRPSPDSGTNKHVAFGAVPRVYALGDANAYYGNSDGQFREAEGHRVWEGEMPLIGTELLTNGQFETDLSGWTVASGSIARVTTQKKFGTASAQATNTSAMRQDISLTSGASYAFCGWIRTVGASATDPYLRFTDVSDVVLSSSLPIAPGMEWTYVVAQYTATSAGTFRIRATTGSATGTVEFDGLSVVRVKDAAGVSTLAFDTRSTTGWAASGGVTLTGVVDAPRGKALRIATTSAFNNATFLYSKQDLSRFRYMGFWIRRVSGTGGVTAALFRSSGDSTNSVSIGGGTLVTGEWRFASGLLAGSGTGEGQFSSSQFYVEANGASSALVFDIGPITLSEFDIGIGARHGLVDPCEDPSLVAWFKMDETSGNLVDSSGNGHVGTAVGSPTYSAATVRAGLGTCIDFDGVDDRFDIADANSLDATTGLTLEAWVNADSLNHAGGGNLARVVDKGNAYRLIVPSNGQIDFATFHSTVAQIASTSAGAITTGSWFHVAGTYDGTNQRIYVNGSLATTRAQTGNIDTSADTLRIGDTGGGTRQWDGKIDEVRIYTRALGPEEVAMRYNATVQQLAKWVPLSSSLQLEQTTDKKDGTYAIKATASAGSQYLTLTKVPMDWSVFTHFALWAKTAAGGDSVTIEVGSSTSNYRYWVITPGTSYGYSVLALGSPTGTVGTPDMAKVTHVRVTDINSGTVLYLDSLKLMAGAETDDWRYAVNAGASNGYSMKSLTTPILNSIPRTYSVNIPQAGKWMVGVLQVATGSGGLTEVTLDGVASGTPQAVPTTTLASQTSHQVYGPFTIATAGDKTLELKVSTVGSMTAYEVDAIALYAYEGTAASPTTAVFPRDLARSSLRTVTPA